MYGTDFEDRTIAIMCYRLKETVHTDPDPMIATARIGLLSNLELWLGIIVACLPTMAPVFRAYVQPGFSKLSHKLYGSSGQSTKEGTPRVQLKTFGGSGPTKSKSHSDYTELSERSTFTDQGSDQLHLVANGIFKLHTECEFVNTQPVPNNDGIHVQKQFQTLHV